MWLLHLKSPQHTDSPNRKGETMFRELRAIFAKYSNEDLAE